VRRRAPRPLAAALAQVTAGLEPASDLAAAQAAWEGVVGAAIAAHATPVAARSGVLEVVCDEAVWAAELELMGPDLADRLEHALGRRAITSLRCRSGPPQSAKFA
jgi:predicted nucleic acid-binding Zn ribbon protein